MSIWQLKTGFTVVISLFICLFALILSPILLLPKSSLLSLMLLFNTQFVAFVTNVVDSTVSVAELTAVAVSGDVAIAIVAALLVDHFHVLMVQYAVFCVAPD